MSPIADQTAGPNGLTFFVDTQHFYFQIFSQATSSSLASIQ